MKLPENPVEIDNAVETAIVGDFTDGQICLKEHQFCMADAEMIDVCRGSDMEIFFEQPIAGVLADGCTAGDVFNCKSVFPVLADESDALFQMQFFPGVRLVDGVRSSIRTSDIINELIPQLKDLFCQTQNRQLGLLRVCIDFPECTDDVRVSQNGGAIFAVQNRRYCFFIQFIARQTEKCRRESNSE